MSTVISPSSGDQRTPLLFNAEISDSASVPPPSIAEARILAMRFFFMATFFSINHGTVTGFAPTEATASTLTNIL